MIRLRLETGTEAREYAFHRAQIRIGRSPSNDLAIPNSDLTARHATLTLSPRGQVRYQPTASDDTTTLFRPDEPPRAAPGPQDLLPGDALLLGDAVRLTLLSAQAEPAPLPPAQHAPVHPEPDLQHAPPELPSLLLPLTLALHRDPDLTLLLQRITPILAVAFGQQPTAVQLVQLNDGTEPEALLELDDRGKLRVAAELLDLGLNRWLDVVALVREGGLTHVPRERDHLLLLSPCRGCRSCGVALAVHLPALSDLPLDATPEHRTAALDDLAQRAAFISPLLAGVARHRRADREHAHLRAENRYFRDRQRRHYLFKELVADSEAMRAVYARLNDLVEDSAPVLLTGDAGTGKELVARALHHLSARKDGLLVAQGCEDADESLLDIVFFGAAAEPHGSRVGIFELADGGTVYLDDIESLPLRLQSRILRVIKEGEIRRHGEDAARPVNVRIVASTRANLSQLAAQGAFRRDLLLALQDSELRIPTLRERPEDILPLLHIFIDHFTRRHAIPRPDLAPNLTQHLLAWSWPGNVRELQSAVEAALLKNTGDPLTATDLGIP